MATTAVLGRDQELARLDEALARADAGAPAAVVVTGAAGIGKSALLDSLIGRSGWVALVADGDEDEVEADGAGVRRLVPSIPAEVTDPFQLGAALLAELGAAQTRGPVMVVLDDAHWLDRASLVAVGFAYRRLDADRVALLLATRPDGFERLPGGLRRTAERLDLAGLSPSSLVELAGVRRGRRLHPSAAASLFEHTGGNPMFAIAALESWTDGELLSEHPLPAPARLAEAVLGRLGRCSASTRRFVEVVAVVGGRLPVATVGVIAGVDDAGPAIDEAVAAGLLAVDGRGPAPIVVPSHPLVRAAVYHDTGPGHRARLHAHAARTLSGDAQLHHRQAASLGPDRQLAADLVEAARRAERIGAHAAAARWWGAAGRISGDPHDSATACQLMAHVLAGEGGRARALTDAVAALGPSARRELALAWVAHDSGRRDEARRRAEQAWAETPADDAERGAVARWLAMLAVDRGDGEATIRWAQAALAADPDAAHPHSPATLLAFGHALRGTPAGALAAIEATIGSSGPAARADAHVGRGVVRLWTGDARRARRDFDIALGGDGLGFQAGQMALAWRSSADSRLGQWDEAIVAAEQAATTFEDADVAWLAVIPHAVAAIPLARRGDWSLATSHLDVAVEEQTVTRSMAGLLWLQVAHAHLAAERQRPEGVADALMPLAGIGAPDGVEPWRALLVEALVALGREGEASEVAACLRSAAVDNPALRLGAARADALVLAAHGAGGDAIALLDGAVAAASDDPYELARTHLLLGALLRRHGKRRRAIETLESGRAVLVALGAQPRLRQCDRELAACGKVSTRRGGRPGPTTLTPVEASVAALVARGCTNREAAAELFMSARTVEHHLTRVYAKLGVRSRTELSVRLGAREP